MSEVAARRPEVPEVVLMRGVAGSGKTTYALELESRGYTRLSIDEEMWSRFGRFGIDYDASRYEALSAEAEDTLRERLVELLAQRLDVVVDFSFWRRSDRDRYKALVEANGGWWRLVHLRVAPGVLRERLAARSTRFDANAAFPVDDPTLDRFLAGFEEPVGEGEEVLGGYSEQE